MSFKISDFTIAMLLSIISIINRENKERGMNKTADDTNELIKSIVTRLTHGLSNWSIINRHKHIYY